MDDENIVGEWFFIETEDNKKGYILGDKLGLLGIEAKLKTPSDDNINNPNILDIEWGNYYALVIGNNNYEYDLDPLKTAVNDAVEIADILENKYGFEVTLSLNATREIIYQELKKLSKILKENDNLLIYYAGHGTVDVKNNEGYWQPIGAKEDAEWTWFSVSELVNQIERFSHIKHILVIADSCFSGTIFQPGHKGSKITDKDNLLMGFDWEYIRKSWRLYGAFIMDEWAPTKTFGPNETSEDNNNHNWFILIQMEQNLILYTIIGMSIITLLIKIIPALLVSNYKIPGFLNKILEFVPIAVLSSMVIQFIIIDNGEINLSHTNELIWASMPTLLVAILFKSLFITIIVGLLSIIVLRYLGF